MRTPRFKLDDIEDYYTFYVLILGISETIFWYYDLSFVLNVADNKTAYENWVTSEREKIDWDIKHKKR